MRSVWAIRLMLAVAVPVAILEGDGEIRPPLHGRPALIVLVVLLTLHFLVVVRASRRR